MPTPAQNRATAQYVKTHMRQFVIRCNRDKDADVIEYLEGCGNVTAEVKRLVRQELDRGQNHV